VEKNPPCAGQILIENSRSECSCPIITTEGRSISFALLMDQLIPHLDMANKSGIGG
jgi:hypothetical protein